MEALFLCVVAALAMGAMLCSIILSVDATIEFLENGDGADKR